MIFNHIIIHLSDFLILVTNSNLTQGLIALLILLIGAALGYFLKKDSGKNAIDNLEISNKVVKSLEKQLKEKNKLLNRLENEKENLVEEHGSTQKSYAQLKEELDVLQEQIEVQSSDVKSVSEENSDLKYKFERSAKELEKLKKLQSAEAKSEKEWNYEINDLKKRLNEITRKHNALFDNNENLKSQIKENSNMVQEMDLLRSENKGYKNKAKQLTKDVEYWEKMHFDVHHKLAALKTVEELTNKELNEKEDLLNGNKIEKQKLLSLIEEYKTKYIKANNLYRSLADKVA